MAHESAGGLMAIDAAERLSRADLVSRVGKKPRYIKFDAYVVNCPAWFVLPAAAKVLWMDLENQDRGNNNGDLSIALSVLKHRGWSSPTTLAHASYALRALGFARLTRSGFVLSGSKVCHLFALTHLPTVANTAKGIAGCQPSNDFLVYQTIAEAEKALAKGMEKLRAEYMGKKEKAASGKKSALQFLNSGATDSEEDRYRFCSRSLPSATDSVVGETDANSPRSAPVVACSPIGHESPEIAPDYTFCSPSIKPREETAKVPEQSTDSGEPANMIVNDPLPAVPGTETKHRGKKTYRRKQITSIADLKKVTVQLCNRWARMPDNADRSFTNPDIGHVSEFVRGQIDVDDVLKDSIDLAVMTWFKGKLAAQADLRNPTKGIK